MGLRVRSVTHRSESVRLRRRSSVSARIARVRASLRSRRLRTQLTHGFLALVLLVSMLPLAALISLLTPAVTTQALSQGPRYATASGDCVNDASYGDDAWTNPGNAFSDNNTNATIPSMGTTSYYLKCTNYGFSIPAGSTINGITVTIGRSGSFANGVIDDRVRLVKGGVVQSHDKADTVTYWPTTEEAKDYGSSSDLWADTWSDTDINASNFGVALAIDWAPFTFASARVDYMRITVEYTVAPTFDQSSYRWFENQDGGGSIDVGSPLNSVAQNTATDALAEQSIFRLRLNLHVLTSSAPGGTMFNFKLQYAARGSDNVCDTSFSNEIYMDVTSSSLIAYGDNTTAASGQALATNANDPTHSGHTLIRQEYRESNTFRVVNTIGTGQDGMWDFALKDNGAPVDTTYCFRVVDDSDGLLDTYTVIPQITVLDSELSQENYRWYNGQDAVPNNTFVQTWGGTGDDKGEAVTQTSDGGYAVAGSTTSYGSGQKDCFVAKYDATGDLQWSRTWGGSLDDYCRDIIQTKDGGLVATGKALSFSQPFADHFLVKYDISGNLLWLRTKGGLTDAARVVEDKDGSLLITGYDWRGANSDMLLTKFTSGGDVIWTRMWGGETNDYGSDIALANDGGYIVSGHSNSFTGSDDILLVKYSADGNFEWSRLHGNNTGLDWGSGVEQLPNGTIVVTGQTQSYGVGNVDIPIILYDSNGTLLSTQSLGGTGSERATDIVATNDGGFAIVGYSDTYVVGGGGSDFLIAKYSSSATLEWTQTWGSGGNDYDQARRIAQTSDGGYVVAGETNSLGAGGADVILLKSDSEGKIIGCSSANCTSPSPTVQSHTPTNSTPSGTATSPVHGYTSRTPSTSSPSASVSHLTGHLTFAKTWGGVSNEDSGKDIVQTSDGGYAVAGTTESYGAGYADVFIAKYDSKGFLSWSRTWGGNGNDGLADMTIIQTSDGGYAITGSGSTFGAGGDDMFILKFAADGSQSWARTWGGTGSDYGRDIVQTSDGGYVVTGATSSYGAGLSDVFIAKYNSAGTLQWSRTWGGSSYDSADVVTIASDGGIVVAGNTISYGAGNYDSLIVKFDSSGTFQWARTAGGANQEYVNGIVTTSDGGLLVFGDTTSFSPGGAYDTLLMKFDVSGNLQWARAQGGVGEDFGSSVSQTADGGAIVSGSTNSYGAGLYDIYLAKYDYTGVLQWSRTWGTTADESSPAVIATVDGGYAVAGMSYLSNSGDMVFLKTDSRGQIAGCSSPTCQTVSPATSSPTPTIGSPTGSTSSPTASVSTPAATNSVQSPTEAYQTARAPWTDLAPVPSRALAAQDTAASGERHDDPLRLRVGLEATGKAAPAQVASLKLQVSPRVGTCDVSFTGESYVDIASSNAFGYYNNTNLADGDWARPGAQEITTAGAKLYQSYEESANFTNRHYIPTSTAGIWDIALTTTDNAPYNSYCFRVVNSDNSTLAEYTRVFELNIPPAASQQMRHGKFFSEITTGGTSDSRQPFYW